MQFLNKLLDNPAHTLRARTHKHLSGKQPGRSLARIHASAVTRPDFCPRRYALSDLLRIKPKDEWLTTSETVTFEIGKMLQDQLIHWWSDMGIAISHWRCTSCGWTEQFTRRPVFCPKCQNRSFKPVEVHFVSEISGISGSFDALVNLGKPRLKLVEVKTIDKDQFKTLKAPLPEHQLRTELYLRLVEESRSPWKDRVDHSSAVIFYVSKGGYGVTDLSLAEAGLNDKFSPFREFTIHRNDPNTQPLADMAQKVWEWRLGKAGMPARMCQDQFCKLAQFCPTRDPCFASTFPAGTPNPHPIETGGEP